MKDLTVIEHQGQRVLTTQQLTEVYETEQERIRQNFMKNQERFIEGKDHFKLEGPELAEFKRLVANSDEPSIKFAPSLILWTERGANKHAKLLNNDKAWEQFDILLDTYFRVKSGELALPSTPLEVLQLAIGKMVEQEKEIKTLQDGQMEIKRTLTLVKDTFTKTTDENWRKSINASLSKIVDASGIDYRTIKTESYQQLETRAGCKLGIRVKNAQDRMAETGATKTAINNYCKLDAIEAEPRLKEIYTSIVKEMTIRYVA